MRRYLFLGFGAELALTTALSVSSLNTATAVFAADTAIFGGRHSELKSPNGMYTIESDSYHLFFLRNKQKKKLPLILPPTNENFYEEDVDVYWSPASTAFSLTDWRGTRTAVSTL